MSICSSAHPCPEMWSSWTAARSASGEGLRESMSFRDSMHQTDLVDTLIYCDLAGHRPDAVVIGMEPADYHTMEIGLTPVCQARLPDLAGKVVEELRARGVIA